MSLILSSVKSSNVKAVGYSKNTGILGVQYPDDSLYLYANVPETIFDELQAATSVGSFLAKNVKDKFLFDKVILLPKVETVTEAAKV